MEAARTPSLARLTESLGCGGDKAMEASRTPSLTLDRDTWQRHTHTHRSRPGAKTQVTRADTQWLAMGMARRGWKRTANQGHGVRA